MRVMMVMVEYGSEMRISRRLRTRDARTRRTNLTNRKTRTMRTTRSALLPPLRPRSSVSPFTTGTMSKADGRIDSTSSENQLRR